jgi:hypothetical protein
MTTDPGKLKAVRESPPTPKNKHEIRSFLGLCTYYGRFISGFVKVAKPLTKLTEEKQAFQWIPEVKATDLEANPEEKEAAAEQQEVRNEEIALEDQYEDGHVAVVRPRQAKKRTQGDGGCQQKLAAARRQLTRRTVPASRKGRGRQGPVKDDVVRGTPKGRTLERRRRTC